MHMRGTKLRQDGALERYFETSDLEVASRVKALIHYVEEQTGVVLAGDSSLYTGLLAHLDRAIQRLRENLNIYNPLLPEIKEDYPALFDLVNRGMEKVFVGRGNSRRGGRVRRHALRSSARPGAGGIPSEKSSSSAPPASAPPGCSPPGWRKRSPRFG